MQDTHAITIAQVALERRSIHTWLGLARQEIADWRGAAEPHLLLQISAMSR